MQTLVKSDGIGRNDALKPGFSRRQIKRTLAIAIALLLAITVVQRYASSPLVSLRSSTVTASDHDTANAKQQRMEKDSLVWRTSLSTSFVTNAPTSYHRYAPDVPLHPDQPVGSQLYKRPPPPVSWS